MSRELCSWAHLSRLISARSREAGRLRDRAALRAPGAVPARTFQLPLVVTWLPVAIYWNADVRVEVSLDSESGGHEFVGRFVLQKFNPHKSSVLIDK